MRFDFGERLGSLFGLRGSFAGSPRSRFVVLLLLGTLILVGVLAYQAHEAVREGRAAATSALRDHATSAAWLFADRAEGKVDHLLVSPGLLHVLATNGGAAGDSAEEIRAAAGADVRTPAKKPPPFLRYAFVLDLDGTTPEGMSPLRIRGVRLPSGKVRGWIADTVAPHARAVYRPDWAHATIVGTADGRTRMIVYAIQRDAEERPVRALGFEADPGALSEPFGYAFDYPPFPPSLTGDATSAELLSVRVRGPGGEALFASTPTYESPFTARERLSRQYGALPVEVTLHPRSAEALLIGGVPSSRLPLLVGLLLLTVGLVAAAIVLLRREAAFARLRGDFVSNVSHELRTPLAQIRLFAETLLLDRVRSDEERRRALEIIDQEARRLGNLVGNILLFSRAERNGTELDIRPVPVEPLLREVADGFRPLAEAKEVDLRVELPGEDGSGGPLLVRADEAALQQILLNFLDNAVKYGPEGQTVTLGAARAGGRVRVRVDDRGPGIEPEDREEIWEPFSRLERERRKAASGTGIGLSVVRELAERQGGRSWVEVSPEGGSRFCVELPGAPEATAGEREAAAERGTEAPTERRTERERWPA